jgi:hypothetical protein
VKNRKSQALGANEIFGEVQSVSEAKSIYISLAVSYSCETEFEIWADFGPVYSTEIFCSFAKVSY